MRRSSPGEDPYLDAGPFSAFFLDRGIRNLAAWDCDAAAGAVRDELRRLLEGERSGTADGEAHPPVEDRVGGVFDALGVRVTTDQSLPDGTGSVDLLFDASDDREEREESFARSCCLLEVVDPDAGFEAEVGEGRRYRTASHRVNHRLDTTDIEWGILTDGRRWRLYGAEDYGTRTYYEVDLPELLERGDLEAFKYFYLFFRPTAFRDDEGRSFLDAVRAGSETADQDLGRALRDDAATAVQLVGQGLLAGDGPDVDPGDRETLDDLEASSVVLVYRLLFVLYAEARGLGETGDRTGYREEFGLAPVREEVLESIREGDGLEREYDHDSTAIYRRLRGLFDLVDGGDPELEVPAYDGDLFDRDDYLSTHAVDDRTLAEVIYRLSTVETGDGRVVVDYADLDTRHLGSVHEGLLEREFRVAPGRYAAVETDDGRAWQPATEVADAERVATVPEGDPYLVVVEERRKTAGAYYTPGPVVTCIVEETLGPVVDGICEDLAGEYDPGTRSRVAAFRDRVTDLDVLDPTMGTGHFLSTATRYLVDRVVAEARTLTDPSPFDEDRIRREVASECLYGVDLDGTAVELARVATWLETLEGDGPPVTLNGRFRRGNSLVGSDLAAVEDACGADLRGVEVGGVRHRLVAMANVHTAEEFGLAVPPGAYDRMAGAIANDGAWAGVEREDWFRRARNLAAEHDFFHWELAFPAVFDDPTGPGDPGFDAVVGNPPYVRSRNLPGARKEYYRSRYDTARGAFDLYVPFVERADWLGGRTGYVVPNKWTTTNYGRGLRDHLLDDRGGVTIVDLSDLGVFSDAGVYPMVLVVGGASDAGVRIRRADDLHSIRSGPETTVTRGFVDGLGGRVVPVDLDPAFAPVAERVLDRCDLLGDHLDVSECIHTGNVRGKLVRDDCEGPACERVVGGEEVDRYSLDWDGRWIRYDDDVIDRESDEYGDLRDRALFEEEKVLIRDISDRPVAVRDDDGFYALNTLYSARQRSGAAPLGYLLAVFNSEFVNRFYRQIYGGTHVAGGYLRFKPTFSTRIPVPPVGRARDRGISTDDVPDAAGSPADPVDLLVRLTELLSGRIESRSEVNPSLRDHLGSYSDGPTLADLGTPHADAGRNSILRATTEEYEKLRIGRVAVERGGSTVTIHATARYKPGHGTRPQGGSRTDRAGGDRERGTRPQGGSRTGRTGTAREYETDRWGYVETDPLPAFRATGLSDREAALVEAFVPVAVEEAGGFAGFRANATRTISLVDRLAALTLPAIEDVAEGVDRYLDEERRAEKLDAEIRRIDDLIDRVVYDLYGLTGEEVAVVESLGE